MLLQPLVRSDSGLLIVTLRDDADPLVATRVLAEHAAVRSVSIDRIIPYAGCSNDTYYNDQWNLHGSGNSVCTMPTNTVGAINADVAWSYGALGGGITIAILDSGIGLQGFPHEDLQHVIMGCDYVNSSCTSANFQPANDDHTTFHGTAVAGIACATINNGLGVAGVAPAARPYAMKVLYWNNSLKFSALLAALLVLAANSIVNAQIVNMSLGAELGSGPGYWSQAELNILKKRIKKLVLQGKLVIAASGNAFQDPYDSSNDLIATTYPAGLTKTVLAVGATMPDGRRWRDLLYFPTYCTPSAGCQSSNYGPWMDLVAPGGRLITATAGITSDYHTITGCNMTNRTNVGFGGTSSTAPQVAGAAALVASYEPDLDMEDVERLLKVRAVKLFTGDFDEQFGYGLVKPSLALSYLQGKGVFHHYAGGSGNPVGIFEVIDSTTVFASFVNLPSDSLPTGNYNAVRYRVRSTVAWPFTFSVTPTAWTRARGTLGWRQVNTAGSYDFDAEVDSGGFVGNVSSTGGVIETFFYRLTDAFNQQRWLPGHPGDARVSFTLIGSPAGTTDVEEFERSINIRTLPNPARSNVAIELTLLETTESEVKIADVAGRIVRVLHHGRLSEGLHRLQWDMKDGDGGTLAPGIYFARIRVGHARSSRRIVALGRGR